VDSLPTPSSGRADAVLASRKAAQGAWVSAPALAAELGICDRTLARWLHDAALGFPRPRVVNKRNYFEREAIDTWKTATAVKAAGGGEQYAPQNSKPGRVDSADRARECV
jgi:hypothetical protein